MAITHLSTVADARALDALSRAEAGDRSGFASAVQAVAVSELAALQDELNARTRVGAIDPLDAAVALFDIFQARRSATPA
jgi:hypothetical protein